MYESCAVHGGDGFAFVIHRDRNETAAIGNPGRELGYGGIANSLAVEFDTWYNPDTNTTTTGVDMIVDHVSLEWVSFRVGVEVRVRVITPLKLVTSNTTRWPSTRDQRIRTLERRARR